MSTQVPRLPASPPVIPGVILEMMYDLAQRGLQMRGLLSLRRSVLPLTTMFET
jgi:hypothetical protein